VEGDALSHDGPFTTILSLCDDFSLKKSGRLPPLDHPAPVVTPQPPTITAPVSATGQLGHIAMGSPSPASKIFAPLAPLADASRMTVPAVPLPPPITSTAPGDVISPAPILSTCVTEHDAVQVEFLLEYMHR
jgi:hypothetical protein